MLLLLFRLKRTLRFSFTIHRWFDWRTNEMLSHPIHLKSNANGCDKFMSNFSCSILVFVIFFVHHYNWRVVRGEWIDLEYFVISIKLVSDICTKKKRKKKKCQLTDSYRVSSYRAFFSSSCLFDCLQWFESVSLYQNLEINYVMIWQWFYRIVAIFVKLARVTSFIWFTCAVHLWLQIFPRISFKRMQRIWFIPIPKHKQNRKFRLKSLSFEQFKMKLNSHQKKNCEVKKGVQKMSTTTSTHKC